MERWFFLAGAQKPPQFRLSRVKNWWKCTDRAKKSFLSNKNIQGRKSETCECAKHIVPSTALLWAALCVQDARTERTSKMCGSGRNSSKHCLIPTLAIPLGNAFVFIVKQDTPMMLRLTDNIINHSLFVRYRNRKCTIFLSPTHELRKQPALLCPITTRTLYVPHQV